MKHHLNLLLAFVGAITAAAVPASAAAKLESWSDGQGGTFRGSPAEVLGPFALFRTDREGGRRVLLRQMSEADCVRFHRALPGPLESAASWKDAKGEVTRELPQNVFRLDGEKLERLDLAAVPEPKLLMLLCVSGSSDRFRDFVEECMPAYERVRAAQPDLFEAVYLSGRRSPADHLGLARGTKMPWLIADFDRIAGMTRTKKLIPGRDQWLWVVNRDGVPLISSAATRAAEVTTALQEFEGLTVLLRPGNRRTWPDRLHYFRAVHAAENRQGQADPLLVGNPVDPAALRGLGVTQLDAVVEVDAGGAVTRVEVAPGDKITAELAGSLGQTLMGAVFVPAVRDGTFVDGQYRLHMEIAPARTGAAAN